MHNLNIHMLGSVAYQDAIALQEQEKLKVLSGESPGSIFFLEHSPAVITLGRSAETSNILLEESLLNERGYFVEKSSRGGDVTVHEPGQLVIYYVLPVKSKNTRAFIVELSNGVIRALNDFYGLHLVFNETNPGIWYGEKKCASIGFDLRQGVSMHGMAINVSNSLLGFSFVNPCGMPSLTMITLSEIAERNITVAETAEVIAAIYGKSNLTYPTHDKSFGYVAPLQRP